MNVTQVLAAHHVLTAAMSNARVRAAIDGRERGPGQARRIADDNGNSFRGDDVRDAFLCVTVGPCEELWPVRAFVDGDPAENVLVIDLP